MKKSKGLKVLLAIVIVILLFTNGIAIYKWHEASAHLKEQKAINRKNIDSLEEVHNEKVYTENLEERKEFWKKEYKALKEEHQSLTEGYEELLRSFEYKDRVLNSLENESKERIEERINSIKNLENYNVWDSKITQNHEYAAFVIGNMDENFLLKYDAKAAKIFVKEDDIACATYWSPSEKFFVLDQGTCSLRGGEIYKADDMEPVDKISYYLKPYWYDEETVIFARLDREIKLDEPCFLDWTTDIIQKNVVTKEEKVLLKGTKDYYFTVKEVIGKGHIIVKKFFIGEEAKTYEDQEIDFFW